MRHRAPWGCAALGVAISLASTFTSVSSASVTCPPDINNDAQVNSADVISVISAWGTCSGNCPADIAPVGGNGRVDVADLLVVVNGWGPCLACGPTQGCLLATPLWCEDFELQNYSRWTGDYTEPTSCEVNGFSTERARAGLRSHKSQVVCSSSDSHRGYGGLRFQGDTVLQNYTSSTGGIDAPNGVVITLWSWLDAPYQFSTTSWVSLLTCTNDCSNAWSNVITLNIDGPTDRLKPIHVSSVTYASNAPAITRAQWMRVTVYLNYHTGQMHVWQNGAKVCNASFSPAGSKMCQWHFGLYASGPNSNVTLFEDDYSIVKLLQPMTNFTVEPRFPAMVSPCGILP